MKITDADGKTREVDVFFDKIATKGRPRKVLTEEGIKLVENMAAIMCTDEEIAQCLNCSRDLFYTEDNKEVYRQAIKKGQGQGKQSLRRLQFELAKKGNCTMLIWLGRQYLNQSENNIDDDAKTTEALERVTDAIKQLRES